MGRREEKTQWSPGTKKVGKCAPKAGVVSIDWRDDDDDDYDVAPDEVPEGVMEGKGKGGGRGGYMQAPAARDVAYAVVDVDMPTVQKRSTPRPARVRMSSFGDDAELAAQLPPNWTLKKFQDEAKVALDEFFVARAVEDTIVRLQELLSACPSEADELGVVALRAALDRDEATQEATVNLLSGLLKKIKPTLDECVFVRSFEKLFCTWGDIAIDAPKAPQFLLQMLRSAIELGVVQKTLLPKLPEDLLNAGLTKAGPEVAAMLAGVAADMKKFKKEAQKSLEEYFVAQIVSEVELFLGELGMAAYHHEFVKKLCVLSFSQPNAETARESTVVLLSQLCLSGMLSKDDLQWGVTRLLSQLDDLELDCPHSAQLAIRLFSAIVSDELVSIPFLRRCRLLRIGGASGVKVVDGVMRMTPEYAKKHLCTAEFKKELHTMIIEYFNSGDEVEFGLCVSELAPLAPHQSSELVRKVISLSIERSACDRERAQRVLVYLCRREELDEEAIEAGFDELYTRMDDLTLDVPDAAEMAASFVEEAKNSRILRDTWSKPSGTNSNQA